MAGESIKTMAGAFLAEPWWKVRAERAGAVQLQVFGNNDAAGGTSSCDVTCDGL